MDDKKESRRVLLVAGRFLGDVLKKMSDYESACLAK
jgi:hypothetical protein